MVGVVKVPPKICGLRAIKVTQTYIVSCMRAHVCVCTHAIYTSSVLLAFPMLEATTWNSCVSLFLLSSLCFCYTQIPLLFSSSILEENSSLLARTS